MDEEQVEMFGMDEVDEFKSALERYGVWPTTVWPLDYQDQKTRRLKELVGDMFYDTTRTGKGFKTPYASEREKFKHLDQAGVALPPNDVPLHSPIPGQAAENAEQPYDRQRGSGCAKDFTRFGRGRGTTRAGSFSQPADNRSVYAGKVTASIFNPAVAAWVFKCFGPDEGATVFDPFAGGGTRAVMAAKAGYRYIGVELRLEEVRAVEARCERLEVADRVTIILGDARDREGIERGWPGVMGPVADFLLTCPPYWNLEQYDGGEADLSMCPTYQDFLREIGTVVENTRHILKPGAMSCWVVGLHRDKDGTLLPLHHDIALLHRRAGFRLREEIILNRINTGALQRVGNFEKGSRRLIRVHEYALLFDRLE